VLTRRTDIQTYRERQRDRQTDRQVGSYILPLTLLGYKKYSICSIISSYL